MKKQPKLSLPQTKAIKELEAIRARIHRQAQKRGWEHYVAGLNRHAGHLLGKSPAPSPARLARSPGLHAFGTVREKQAARRADAAPAA